MTENEALLHNVHSIDSQIAILTREIEALREDRRRYEARLLELATDKGEGFSGEGYKVRWTAGRTVTHWNADQLWLTLPESIREAAITEITTFRANGTILAALEKEGKLPADALQYKTVTEPNGRWVLEKEQA